MKRALLSDIHANYEALTTVLDDVRDKGISEIYCLGDIVGYGPNPCECLDMVISRCQVSILGNHDQATLFDPDGFNPVALNAVYWTRDELESHGTPSSINNRWDYLGALPRSLTEDDLLFVHGSPREPTNEYVFPEDVYNQNKMSALFNRITSRCFQGHTHIPGVFTESGEFLTPEDCDYVYRLTDQKIMVNVGSVGQPRDGDKRACYVVLTDEEVQFHRCEYASQATAQKIYNNPELDNMLGDRLLGGR